MKVDSGHDYSISLIRLIALTFIITCHIMQFLDMELAWWFNVGVQVFLCISGFLYGRRGVIDNEFAFYKKNLVKILVDYYIVVICAIVLQVIITPESISLLDIAKALLTYGTLNGGEHLWYIPVCLLCYFITPFLSRYFSRYKNTPVRALLLACAISAVTIELFFRYFNSAWIVCYILGYFLGMISSEGKEKLYRSVSIMIAIGAVLLNAGRIVCEYIMHLELEGNALWIYQKYSNYSHVALGITLFVLMNLAFSKAFAKGDPRSLEKVLKLFDKYSYDTYLVHHFVILGPFSLMKITGVLAVNILLVLTIIAVSAVIVNSISVFIKNRVAFLR